MEETISRETVRTSAAQARTGSTTWNGQTLRRGSLGLSGTISSSKSTGSFPAQMNYLDSHYVTPKRERRRSTEQREHVMETTLTTIHLPTTVEARPTSRLKNAPGYTTDLHSRTETATQKGPVPSIANQAERGSARPPVTGATTEFARLPVTKATTANAQDHATVPRHGTAHPKEVSQCQMLLLLPLHLESKGG